MRLQFWEQEIQHRDFAFRGAHIVLGANPVGEPVEVALGAIEALMVGRGAALLAVLVGVEIAIEFHDAHLHALGQQQVDGAFGRIRARRIGIEIHRDAVRVPFDGLHLLRGERGAATGHDIAKARCRHADRVHITFHQDCAIVFAHAFLGAVQVVEHVALLIDAAFRANSGTWVHLRRTGRVRRTR